jgi:hypothetical protein
MQVSLKKIRDRAWLSLSPQTAAAAGITLAELQQFCAGAYWPSDQQIRILARLLKFESEEIA